MRYKIFTVYRGIEDSHFGTLDELVDVFSYILKCGNETDEKIPLQPNSIEDLIKALLKSNDCMGHYYDRIWLKA